jgi:hypothetical protein
MAGFPRSIRDHDFIEVFIIEKEHIPIFFKESIKQKGINNEPATPFAGEDECGPYGAGFCRLYLAWTAGRSLRGCMAVNAA